MDTKGLAVLGVAGAGLVAAIVLLRKDENGETTEPGSLHINSVPSGASVSFSGETLGVTPLIINGIQPGNYNISLTLEGYLTYSETVTIQSDKIVTINATLIEGTEPILVGILSIDSSPDGATVKVDNVERGVTPLVIPNMQPGTYNVSVSLEGYSPWSGQAIIIADQTTIKIVSLALLPVDTGGITINSTPTGAKVYFDGEYEGDTPITLNDKPIGSYIVSIEKEGFNDYSTTVTIVKDIIGTLSVGLSEDIGTLSLSYSPSNTIFTIDADFDWLTEPVHMVLTPGDYTLPGSGTHLPTQYYHYTAEANGYLSSQGSFRILNGQITELKVDLPLDTGNDIIISDVGIVGATKIWNSEISSHKIRWQILWTINTVAPIPDEIFVNSVSYPRILTEITIRLLNDIGEWVIGLQYTHTEWGGILPVMHEDDLEVGPALAGTAYYPDLGFTAGLSYQYEITLRSVLKYPDGDSDMYDSGAQTLYGNIVVPV